MIPGEWTDDRIRAYMVYNFLAVTYYVMYELVFDCFHVFVQLLLRDREEAILEENTWKKPSYFFMSPFFMFFARKYYKGARVS